MVLETKTCFIHANMQKITMYLRKGSLGSDKKWQKVKNQSYKHTMYKEDVVPKRDSFGKVSLNLLLSWLGQTLNSTKQDKTFDFLP